VLSGLAGQQASCDLKIAGANSDTRATSVQFDLVVDASVATYTGANCPSSDGSDLCNGATGGKLPSGHTLTSTAKPEGLSTFIAFLIGENFITPAYYDGPVLVGDASFITVNYSLQEDSEGVEVSLPDFVGSNSGGVALDYSIEGGVIVTSAF